MKKFTIKTLCIMLALFMVIGCAGCGQEKETTVSSEDSADIYGDLTVEYDSSIDTGATDSQATDSASTNNKTESSSSSATSSSTNSQDTSSNAGSQAASSSTSSQATSSNVGSQSASSSVSSQATSSSVSSQAASSSVSSQATSSSNSQAASSSVSSQATSSNAQTPTGDIFSNVPMELKGSTVKVAHWGDEGGDRYQALAKAFTKKTNINVKWQLFNQLSYESDILKQIASGNGPDVVILNDKVPQTYEVAQPLPVIFNVNDGFWNPAISEHTKFNGKYYFVNSYNSPFTIGSLVIYNKKIFSQNGIKSPLDYYNAGNGTWSFEDLKQCMLDATSKGFYGGVIDPMTIAAQMGVSMFKYDAKTGKVSGNVTDEKLLSAVRYYAECREEGLCGNYFIANYPSGNIAIALSDPYSIKYNGYLKDMSPSDYGAVMAPTKFEGKDLPYLAGHIRAYGIAKQATNVEGAYYFLRYFLDLDKYNEAGIQIFGNKEMQKFYTETFSKAYATKSVFYKNLQGPLTLVNSDWLHSKVWQEARNVAPGQVSVSMAKNANIVENAVTEANKKLSSIK